MTPTTNKNPQLEKEGVSPAPVAPEAAPPVLPPKVEQPAMAETKPPETDVAEKVAKTWETGETAKKEEVVVAPPAGPEVVIEPPKAPDQKPVTPPANPAELKLTEKLSVLQDEVGAILPPEQ